MDFGHNCITVDYSDMDVTVDVFAIARRAGVCRTTVYRYMQRKRVDPIISDLYFFKSKITLNMKNRITNAVIIFIMVYVPAMLLAALAVFFVVKHFIQ